MTHLTSINVRSRRVLATRALLCSFRPRTSKTAPTMDPARITLHRLALSPSLPLPHSSLKYSYSPGDYRSKSHNQSRIHPASGSLQTALS
jgi:hypothetical protein